MIDGSPGLNGLQDLIFWAVRLYAPHSVVEHADAAWSATIIAAASRTFSAFALSRPTSLRLWTHFAQRRGRVQEWHMRSLGGLARALRTGTVRPTRRT